MAALANRVGMAGLAEPPAKSASEARNFSAVDNIAAASADPLRGFAFATALPVRDERPRARSK